LLFAVTLSLTVVTHAQVPASCTFRFFPAVTGFPTPWTPLGVNDWGTVVGGGVEGGEVRLGGTLITVSWVTQFVDRDNGGITVGFTPPVPGSGSNYGWFLWSPQSYTNLDHLTLGNLIPVDHLTPGNVNEFTIRHRNKYGSTVGTYLDSNSKVHGFKRWNGGSYVRLDYPGSSRTAAEAINDLGAIVGSYTDAGGKQHGFIYANGQWATLDFPQATSTDLAGIANGGTIVGNAQVNGTGVAFVYRSGTFKTISVPNFPANSTTVVGTSLNLGVILGTYPNGGFTANCN